MNLFKKKEPPKPEKPHIVGDGCKKCINYNNGYCKGRDRCCEANNPIDENSNKE